MQNLPGIKLNMPNLPKTTYHNPGNKNKICIVLVLFFYMSTLNNF